ncbi:MAG: hypothetical protein CVV27_02370 [Candidatus Melainabacteria bacterium HGW-Melainabacteria-1]|nr:MAG: hypothetical protein CVV27_02370 [Candidatus Melainabacteria bacterium HGW-Melainabacteria-1]
MVKRKSLRPAKEPNLMQKIRVALASGDYLDTVHASERQAERNITAPEYEYVLKHGWHEASKDRLDESYDAWNYAIRGRTLEQRELRVIVSFDPAGLLIITVIDLEVA